jgi:nucleoside-diphosphate-sugar epimerase
MPVIVVGADTPEGERIVERILEPGREVRVFVTDPDQGRVFKEKGAKVAVGDVSDDTHIAGAATRCFSAVLIGSAATDTRERSFAKNPEAVLAAWARGVADVRRVIWVHDGETPEVTPKEVATVSPEESDLAEKVAALDDVASL